ncbi:hypothetical protein EDC17_103117 [Sphingobacterium alimentarium]|uniref:DUF5689 domain-containing protein n=1 Tax=Sphingobacterium alimentarium TaxID=797292 RepID=A0A4V2VU31_9SPHI|nr:DUF5689 domain-containing protein [Sphingobacterium alimentarium]TCV10855.1 hypothetical protein EDC17_103117 [Sphingobacterium alimentarium]
MKNLKNIGLVGILATTMLTSCLKEDENYSIGTSNPETSLFTIRNIYNNAEVRLNQENLSEAKYFKGLVVSNKDGKNLPSNYVAVQNTWRSQTRGILIEVDNGTQLNFGDSVLVNVESATLTTADNMLLLKGVAKDKFQVINSGNTVKSTPVSISALQNNFANFESTYVDVTADLENEPAPGTPLKGNKVLVDGDNNKLNLFTADDASFANEVVAPSATFIGIPFKQNNEIQLRLQSYQGMAYPSGRIYSGWPESFENNDIPKGSYNMAAINNNVNFQTGQWHLFQSIIGDTQGRDRIVSGTQAIRFQQNLSVPALLQMNFDVPNGASKVTLWYGAYYTDRSSSFKLEYSQDQGATWTQLGETISDAHTTSQSLNAKQAVFLMNIEGPVRFRITKLGLGTSSNTVSNGRLGIDEISVFRSY